MKKVLFITEKYHSGPSYGLTNNMYNLIGSYECSEMGTFEHFFIDPENIWSSHGVDEVLLSREYDIAIVSVYHHLPSIEVAKKIGNKIIMCWWDSIVSMDGVRHWSQYTRQFCFDWGKGEEFHNCFCMHVPQDERLFYRDDNVNEDIDVSFVGSIDAARPDRRIIIDKIKNAGFNLWAGGGRGPGQSNLSIEEYANIFRRSKLCLNLSYGHGNPQRKGRSFEIAACGQVMLANCCHMLNGWFTPEVDYFSFDDFNLIDRLRYFLDHDDERKMASDNIYKKYKDNYSSKHFWEKAFGSV